MPSKTVQSTNNNLKSILLQFHQNDTNLTHKIYKLTSKTTGRAYIGCTSKNVEVRKMEHLYHATYGSTQPIHQAIREFGIDDFVLEVLDSDDDLDHARNVLERSYIDLHETYTTGYNATKGGDGQRGRIPSAETRKKWKASFKEMHTGSTWYTDGVKSRRVAKGMPVPHGMYPGFTKKRKSRQFKAA